MKTLPTEQKIQCDIAICDNDATHFIYSRSNGYCCYCNLHSNDRYIPFSSKEISKEEFMKEISILEVLES